MRRVLSIAGSLLIVGLFATALVRSGPQQPIPFGPAAAPMRRSVARVNHEVAPAQTNAEYIGQFDWTEPGGPRFAWSASQVRVRFTGTSLAVHLTETPVPDEIRDTDRLAVEVDGVRRPDLALEEGSRRYVLARGLSEGAHQVVLTKLTEAEVGTVALRGFELSGEGELLPPLPRKARWMEVIGDSISAGYGVLGESASCGWSAQTEDASRTYGAVAAQALEADLVLEAWSGKGVYRNFNADDPLTMPKLFERAIPSAADSPRGALAHLPELVVINLGTNDLLAGKPDARGFLGAYRMLIERVRARAPKAALVLVVSPLLADDHPFPRARSLVRSWLERLKAERERRGERAIVLDQYVDPQEGLGCDGHPNQKTQARLGAELAQAVRDQLGW